ncbi:MAG TPA: bacteriohopanetetrol glucosamine biosynthesis glycosyltransferase HpnI [Terriglobia bacterium]|nr:bacteriohopanetetrol glucosamine biosynthesis glycosyltransferase HpnI [Terriglobia bacterium]
MLLTALRWLALAAAAAPFVYYLAAVICALGFFRRRDEPVPDFCAPVSILKPMRGLDRETYENLASLCRQRYPSYELLICVENANDAAIPVIQKLVADFPNIAIRLLIGSSASGSNNKVNKLSRLAAEARYNLFVASDSDIRVDPDYLSRVVLPFRDQGVGAVTCLYRGVASPGIWSELEDVALTADFLPGVLVARKLGVKFLLGATMAVGRQALDQIDGFEALADAAADDHELGSRIAACGYRVEFAHTTVETECCSRSFADFFRQRLRWAVVTRESRHWGHFGFLFAQGLPWTIVAAAVAPSRTIAVAYVAAYVALRLASAFTVGVWGLRDSILKRKWWLVFLGDAFGFVVWFASLFARRVVWQNTVYEVRNRHLISVAPKRDEIEKRRRTKQEISTT